MSRAAAADTTATEPLPYRALLWLAVATFSTGIDGYVLAGLLPAIAADLSVTEAVAGQLVSVFALVSAVAAPVLGAATGGWERRGTIASSLAVFVVGNAVVAAAPGYGVALTGRVVAALGASLLNAAISAYVIHLAPSGQRGRALSFVLGGWMTATALGVPAGLVLGQASWRFPLIMVAVVGGVALIGILAKLPPLRLPPMRLRERLRPLGKPQLVAGLLVTTGILCASYTCFTYAVLILGPTHPAGWMIILIMFGYGLASMLGNAASGRLADRFTPVTVLTVLVGGLLLNAVTGGVVLSLAPTSVVAVVGLVWFFVAGIGNGGAAVPQQARLAGMAPEAAAVVMALNASAISLGAALGSGLGGGVLSLGAAPPRLLFVSAVVLAVTVTLHLVLARWSRRAAR